MGRPCSKASPRKSRAVSRAEDPRRGEWCIGTGSTVLRAFHPHRHTMIQTEESAFGLFSFEVSHKILLRPHPVFDGQRTIRQLVAKEFVRMLPHHRFGYAGRERRRLFHGF